MDEKRVQDTVDSLRAKSSEELLRLYEKGGHADEGFEALRRLLVERNVPKEELETISRMNAEKKVSAGSPYNVGNNFMGKAWYGEESLRLVYWVYGVLFSSICI